MQMDAPLVSWIEDYLTGRPQFVRLRNCVSDPWMSNTGAPQGTMLSPFLFTTYTADFQYHSVSCHLQKYSDDTAIFGCVEKGQEEEYRDLVESFVRWCRENHLQLNVTKTKEMVVDFRKSIKAKDANRLNKLIKKAGSVVGCKLANLDKVVRDRMVLKVRTIMDNPPHPLHNTVDKLRSSFRNRLLQPHCSKERGEDFMSFFTDKVLAIREKANQAIPTTGPSPDVPTVGTYRFSNEPLNSFTPIYFSEASLLIQKSKTTTCLLDPIPTHLLKDVLPLIGSSILDQINGSLVSGYVPRSYKVAVIKPLLKKPSLDPDVLANYRPISNLPFISKVLEKVVVTQLLEHLQMNSLFEMFQSGSGAHHSTETALLKVANDLLIASDHGLVSMLVMLDLSAAFDTVDHSILLHRLEHVIGIKRTALDGFRSYLSDRYQFAHVHGVPSSYSRVSHGVSQGSVLGPILFTLYMLPLGNIIWQHGINFHCYADDTQLYLSMKPEETEKFVKLQTCLKDIKSWMSSNFLLLNSGKTEVMVFGPEPLRDRLDYMITLDGISLTSSLSVRNLGVTFDQNLSFNSHIKLVSRSAFFCLRNITKIRKLLTRHDAEKLIHAFVTSRLDYCNSLLSGCPNNSLRSLQLIQNAAARVLTGIDKRDHITPVMALLHWLPVKFRIIFKTLLLTYKVLKRPSSIVPGGASDTLSAE
ncbi:putative RNA-directed DNA polymerase from transposon X-element [Takifugu flavidus]|uniref:Putative RNA-directed DNA polymerase from transposon X-element n=1 Tax=Takifugu flavidus TaxID=433684 RepID=A0A5C6NNN6_9TELE|nr:putative RNA-directed DNA polymerase from transposon X-element [Takifugu flavidus]